jgi:hypothetical protein
VVFFDASENPLKYELGYAKKKIAHWKACDDVEAFFLRQPVKTLMPFLDGFPQIQAEIEKAISSGKLKKGEMWAYKDGPTFADQAMLAFANVIVDFELKDHEDELFNTYTQTVRWLCEEHGQEITERGLTHYRSLAATSNHLRLSGYARKFIDLHESILANKARKEIEEDLDGELKVRAARPRHI